MDGRIITGRGFEGFVFENVNEFCVIGLTGFLFHHIKTLKKGSLFPFLSIAGRFLPPNSFTCR